MEGPYGVMRQMAEDRARMKIKIFSGNDKNELSDEVDSFLSDIRAKNVVDIKHSSNLTQVGIMLHTIVVVYQTYEN